MRGREACRRGQFLNRRDGGTVTQGVRAPLGVHRGCCHGDALEAQLPRPIRNSPHRTFASLSLFTVYITRAPPRFAGNETVKKCVMEALRKYGE